MKKCNIFKEIKMLSSEEGRKIDELYKELAAEKEANSSANPHSEEKNESAAEHHHSSGEHHHSSGEHHHSSGSHHHHHHHRHKSSSGGLKQFLAKNKKGVKAAAVIFLAIAVVAVLATFGDKFLMPQGESQEIPQHGEEIIGGGEDVPEKQEPTVNEKGSVCVGLPVKPDEIYTVGVAAREYIASDSSVNVRDVVKKYMEEGTRLDVEYPVTLSFDIQSLPENYHIVSASVELSEKADYRESRIVELAEDYSVNIYHLKTGTKYYYRLHLTLSDESVMTFGGTFETADTPRVLSIGGIRNVRDIGGWKTTDGKEIKQGLLYRGTEVDGAVKEEFHITEEGVFDMINVLGIRTDMDLRYPENSVPGIYALGASVEHTYYSGVMYKDIFTDSGKEKIRTIFGDLAKKEKYPVYLHCTYGADRTGTVCYLLEAVLGLSEADLIREYELTGLFSASVTRDLIAETIDELKTYEGEDMKEKVENYLLSAGVTIEEIEEIRHIFLG